MSTESPAEIALVGDNDLLPAPRPVYPGRQEHGPMHLRAHPVSREQEWCGTWYDCADCNSTTLLASPELLAQLADQAKVLAGADHA